MLTRLTLAVSAAALLAGGALAQTPSQTSTQTPATGAAAQPGGSAASAAAPAAAPASGQGSTAAPRSVTAAGDIVATAQASGQFSTLLKAAEATGLTPVLKGAGPLTVFAPTDAAFAALPPGELDRLMADKPALQRLLAAHVVNTRVTSDTLKGKQGKVPTVANVQLSADGSGDQVKVANATIVQADIRATNGVIHVVDRVINPNVTPTAAAPAADDAAATASDGGTASATGAAAQPGGAAAKPGSR